MPRRSGGGWSRQCIRCRGCSSCRLVLTPSQCGPLVRQLIQQFSDFLILLLEHRGSHRAKRLEFLPLRRVRRLSAPQVRRRTVSTLCRRSRGSTQFRQLQRKSFVRGCRLLCFRRRQRGRSVLHRLLAHANELALEFREALLIPLLHLAHPRGSLLPKLRELIAQLLSLVARRGEFRGNALINILQALKALVQSSDVSFVLQLGDLIILGLQRLHCTCAIMRSLLRQALNLRLGLSQLEQDCLARRNTGSLRFFNLLTHFRHLRLRSLLSLLSFRQLLLRLP